MANNYSAWSLSPNDFPSNEGLSSQIKFILQFGILAPSTHNSQPWQLTLESENRVVLRPDMNIASQLRQVDPQFRQLCISLGSFLSNTILAAECFGFSVDYEINAKTIAKANVIMTFKKVGIFKHSKNLDAMMQRRSNKFAYREKVIPQKKLDIIKQKDVLVFSDLKSKELLATLYRHSASEFATKPFTEELVSWMRPPHTNKHDGMPASVQGMKTAQFYIGRILMTRAPKLLEKVAASDYQKIANSSAIAIVSTKSDTIVDWIVAGKIMEDFICNVVSEGIDVTIMQATIESPANRKEIKALLDGGFPQVFLRLGYSINKNAPHTPRKPIDSFIIGSWN